MQRAGGDAQLPQRRDLVVHQRDQRRDDDRGARTGRAPAPGSRALAAAGRHQHERVAAGEDVAHHLLLQAAEAGEAEDAPQHLPRVAARGSPIHAPMLGQ